MKSLVKDLMKLDLSKFCPSSSGRWPSKESWNV